MGNEASLEGGEGLGAFPEGAAAAGDGSGPAAPLQHLVPAGVEADLSQLSEEERRQIAAVMSRAQGLPRGNLAGAEPPPMQRHPELDTSHHPRQPGKPPDPGPPSLSKSRTVDVLKTEQRAPGRSPSSISLRESRSRTDFKEDQKPSMMPSFLSEANPLSAVTSVVNKFNPFDLISDSDSAHEEAGRKQKVTQKEQGKPEEQRGLAKHPAQQQSPKPTVQQQGAVRPTPQQIESSKPVPQQQQPGEPKQVQKPGPGHPADTKLEQAKQPPQPRGPQKPQPQQPEPTKPAQQQTSAKPSSGPAKPSPHQPDNARTSSQAPPLTKPSSQQPGPAKQPSQQPARQGGPVKPASQQAGPPKQPPQQPGPEKPSAQQPGPAKQPSQPAPGKPPPQQTGLVKQVPPQAGAAKPSSQTAGATKPLAQQPGPTKPSGQQPGPDKPLQQKQAGATQPAESAPKKTFCPLCTTTELLLHAPEKANYNTCTQCHTVVCSLCGFNPNPHITEIKEWLCLNCQMQRALGGDLAPSHGPRPQPPPPKQKTPIPPSTAKPSPQPSPVQKKDASPKPDPTQLAESKKPLPQKKQPSLPGSPPVKSKQPSAEPTEISQQTDPAPKSDQAKPAQAEDKQKQPSVQKPTVDTVPPSETPGPKQDSAGPRPPPTQQKVTDSPKPELAKPSQDAHAAGDKPDSKPLPQASRQKSDPKLVSQPGARPDAKTQKPGEPTQTKDDPKKLQTKLAPKPDTKPAPKGPQAGAGPKPAPAQLAPQPQPPQKTPEQPRRFSLNLGGITDAPKPQPTTPQETVTGKLFGFGASIFSQASNLISTAGQPGSQASAPAPPAPAAKQPQPSAQPPTSQAAPKEAAQAQPPPKAVPVKKEAKPLVTAKSETSKADSVSITKGSNLEKKPGLAKDSESQAAEAKKPDGLSEPEKASQPEVSCPLCKTGLNIGSKDPPNFNTCTECKKVVCNLCGFNPMPHIAEVQEWLCLNCQTQRAMSGQLGDMGKVPLPKTGPSQPVSKPPASPQKQPMPAVSHSPQKTSTPPTAAKLKEEPGVQKEVPKLQQGRLEKTLSADKLQQGAQIEDAKLKQGKLVKTPSADKIQRVSQKEDPRLQQTKLTKTASSDKILHGLQKEDVKFQEAKLAKTSSADKILHGVQKEDITLQEAKLIKTPSADKILHGIQKEDPKLQQMKMAKALSADKIQPTAQKEDKQLQEVKLSKAVSVDKIQHVIQKEDPKLQHEKIMKTSSVDKIQQETQKEESKLQQAKLSKTLSAEKIPATVSSDQKKPLSTLEEDKKPVLPAKSTPHPEDKKEQITAETKDHVAEQKAEAEEPDKGLQAKKQEDVKKEGLTTGISELVLKAEKAQGEEIPVQTAPLPRTGHVEAAKEKTEKEDDKSDTSSSQQQKSPQGLSDTGYSSDGISSSLGEIPSHIPSDEKDLLRESSKKDTVSQESPPSPSDLAKLESTVLSILEAQATTLSDEKSAKSKELYEMYSEQTKDPHKTKPLPVTPESYSSDEEDLESIQKSEKNIVEGSKGSTSSQADYKEEEERDDLPSRRQRYDSVEDSSESENSPVPRRKRRASVGSSSSDEYKRDDSQGSGDEEDFIRKQIIEMSADEDASGSEDDEFIRNQLKEISITDSQKKDEVKSKAKGTAGKHRRMARKSSASYDEDAGRRHSWHDDDDETFDESPEPKYRETKSQDSEELAVTGGGGLRRFKTIELNSTITNKYSEASEQQKGILYFDEEPELEMESLTDSPEDRSRGEGSSSLHASSFTPGTSPTSVSSLDEDSDSSPSHKKLGGESKQRKSRHRSHGPLLPTIEDSSEEEELREEEELLKEQEKQRELEQQQRKSSSKKSKKDKDELRAQRRRERPKTPPSNLSPIEDASPTEELRQAAEMEELHRSSCSEYSPSIESDPEGFEISPEKIIEVQKVYKLPTAVSLYSPTDEQPTGLPKEESGQKTLRSAEEVYEEMMHKTHKSKPFQIANEKDEVFEKESLYGGMLIEDYIYESLVEDSYNGSIDTNLMMRQDESNEYIQQRGKEKKIRASEQIYEEPQKITDLQKDYYSVETLRSIVPQEDIVSSSYIIPESHEIVVLDSTVASTSEEKQLLDAEAAYEELMKRQRKQLTPGSSPTQPTSGFVPTSDTKASSVGETVDSASLTSSTTSAISDVSPVSSTPLSIPDVKITQHFTAEEIEDEYLTDYAREIQEIISHETSMLTYSETSEGAASVLPSDTASLTSSTSSVCTTDSSSPIDSATTGYVDKADAVDKIADSEGVRIIAQVPLTSTKEYSEVSMPYESVAEATKKPSISSDMESVDQAVVCLSETAPSAVVKPKQYETDTVTFDTSKAEKEAARKMKSTLDAGIVKIHPEDSRKELGVDMTRINLTSATSEQPPICIASVPVTEPASETSSVSTPSVVSKTSIVSVPSSAPAVTSKVFSLFRSSSLDSSAQPSPPLPPPPPPPPPPPLPPPILPKPAIYPKKKPQIKTPAATAPTVVPAVTSVPTLESPAVLKNHVVPVTKTYTPTPPPVPPKPSSIPAGLVFSHRPTEVTKPPVAPKPAVPPLPIAVHKPSETQPKPIGLSLTSSMTLNLVSAAEYKIASPTSPLSPHSNKSSPRLTKPSQETYVVITLPSEPGTPTEPITSQAVTSWPLEAPSKEQIPQPMQPIFTPSMKTMEIQSITDQSMYISGALQTVPVTTQSAFEKLPSSKSEVVTREVTKTTVSVVKGPAPAFGLGSVAITIPPEPIHIVDQPRYRENGRFHPLGDVIDLRTLTKMDIEVRDNCMDLSAVSMDVRRQMPASDTCGRPVSTVQPSIINLSTTCVTDPSLSVVTETVTVVTCTAPVSYTASTDSLVDLGHAMTTPLQLTTTKHFEPAYRVTGSPAFSTGRDEVPINLSLGTSTHAVTWATTKPVTVPPVGVTNGWTDLSSSQEPIESGAVDLSTTKSHRTVVTMDETASGIITTVIEDDEKPVDLTAGRRAVCCDMVYKLPFGRSCTAQQPPTTLPEDRFGYRDDHYQYDRSGSYGYRGMGGMKPSMSDTNLSEAGLFAYKSKNSFNYRVGATDAAVDLTSGRVTTGEVMDYSSKTTGPYPETRQVISGIGLSTPQYSQARMVSSLGSQFGVGSVLRSSNGVVYSSVATPIPSTFAITTQPGSIFSTSVRDLPTLQTIDSVPSLSTLQQNQPLPRSYSFLTTVAAEKDAITAIDMETGLPPLTIETITTEPTNLIPALTTASEVYTDAIEDEVALLIAPEEGKQQQLDLERELLELEKIKQQRFAEELEWERQEIQRFREQEKFMVQKKLEELQSMKHHLLFQQEEERQAQFMMRQETLAQQQLQLEQFQQLQQQLHQQLEEQKIRQIYQYGYEPSGTGSPQTTTDQTLLEGQYATTENGQFWPTDDATTTASGVLGIEIPQSQAWYTVQSDGITQYIPRTGILSSVSEMSLKDIDVREEKQLKKRSSMPKLRGPYEELEETLEEEPRCFKKIVDSGVQTDDEDGADRGYTNRRRRTKKSVDTSVQTDDEDQDEWDLSSRSRRKPRVGKYSESTTEADKAKQFSKVSSIAVQTVAEISVQTEPVGTIRTPSIRARLDAKVEIIKHISAPEKTYKGESLGCQTETESDTQSPQYLSASSPQKDKKRPTPLEIGYSTHLHPDSTLQVVPSPPKSPKVLYSPISPVSPSKVIESAFVPYEKPITDDISPQKMLHADIAKVPPSSPKATKMMQRSMSDPKPLSPTAEDSSRAQFQYTEGFMTKGSSSITPSGTQKKVKRTLPNPPPEEATAGTQLPYTSVGSVSRRRICRTTTMARAKILQDIDRELDLVERESAKLRKKQAELDEEEKEIDAKLRYLEMGINRRKEALLKEREKRERAYLQGVAEERDYMSDSEVNNTRSTRIETQHGLERPRTAPQTEFNQFMPPQTQPETQFAPATSPYAQYQYSSPALPTQAPTQFTQQSHYQQQQPLYHQQVSPYQTQTAFQTGATMSFTPQAQPPPSQQPSYQLPSQMMVIQPKPRQTTLYLEPKITTNYDVIRNQPLMIAPVSTDNNYAVSQLGSKYSTLDLRIGLDERNSIASSPISSISTDSFYADIDHHHTPRNYVLIDDIGELTKGTGALGSSFSLHEKDLTKTDRLLRTTEARRAQEVSDFLAPLQTSSRLHSYVKADEDPMEDPYELKLLKHQIKQEFRRGAESLDHLAGLSQYYHAEGSYRHFPKSEKYSIGRLTLEKQAAKQLPAALLYQKQSKHKKALIDPKLTKFSPIQESRDLEPDYSSYMTSSTSTLGGITTRARLLQDDITFGLRKNITDQQKYMGPQLTSSIGAGLGTALGPTMRSTLQDEADKSYSSGSRSRPSSRPSSVYGLDLSLKRDSSSSSLRLKAQEAEPLDVSFSHAAPSGRTKPTSLPISQSRGRIPIVAQNSEEESPLSPVGQPMGMARAAAGPLPPISADTRDQFGSSHSLPEVQQHMREESRTRGYDRDIAFIMDDFQHAMSDSEAYHLRREETDWFDKPRDSRLENGHGLDRRLPEKLSHSRPPSQHQDQINGKPLQYIFPHARLKLLRDPKDHTVSGNGLGIRVVGGKEIPGSSGEIGAYIAKILPGGNAELTGKLIEGMQVLEWNGIPLTGKTYEEVQSIIIQQSGEAEICVRLDLNMLSDSENPQHLELQEPVKAVDKAKSPGVDPKQLAAELQKVSLQQSPLVASSGMEKGSHVHSGTTSATSSAVPSPGQPGSPSVSKKRHSSKPTETVKSASHSVTGEIQLQINYDKHLGNLIIHILQARNLAPRDNNGYSDPFVKVYLLPGRGQVMVVQNASAEYKRRTKYVQKSLNPEWNQTVIYKNISTEQLKKKTLEVTVWDYDRFSSNDFLGEVLIELSSVSQLDNTPRWYPLKEQSENIDHGKPHSGQSSQQSPKPSVIKSRSHGIFPDPSKDMQVPTIEKSHSSPGSSKSSSEGHLRSHGPSRSQSKTSVTQTHLEDAGAAIAAAEAAVQQLRLQPTAHKSGQSNHARKQHRHSIAGVLPIQRTQSDNLPPPANDNKDQSQLALRKVMSDGPVKPEGARSTNHRPAESSVSTGSSASSFGSGYSMDSEGSSSATGENNLFPIPRIGKMSQNGQEPVKQSGVGLTDAEGKTQVMGEIKIALKKEMKTDGEQLIVEILQCRNITYKFKSPDHLPDLYVKLYVVNISTQKRVIKKKTRVCRHDREPSFNETFRFSLSPAGHSLQILLVSNGGKFMKKTLIGEAYIWLDKVDLRKRIVNWHKLLVSSTQTH
ncbi:protein piccolo isoform C [Patagioenas fasciata monilis]|uniref:Protein piccolo n=1 Tax=Patagioenas fasciata monilis TaxID=372326 RepID=A0A1V4K078_PATFA|nr:protein piccolo isoform C [Patagioenas fasciata monilis]